MQHAALQHCSIAHLRDGEMLQWQYQIPDDDYPVLGTNTNFQFKKILKLHSCKIYTIADHHDMKFQAKDYYCIFSTETEVLLLL